MQTFVALFRGPSIKTARMISTTADPGVVALVSRVMLKEARYVDTSDPIIDAVEGGRRSALQRIEEQSGS